MKISIDSVTDKDSSYYEDVPISWCDGCLVILRCEQSDRDWFSDNDFNFVWYGQGNSVKRDRMKFVIILKDCIKIPIDNEL